MSQMACVGFVITLSRAASAPPPPDDGFHEEKDREIAMRRKRGHDHSKHKDGGSRKHERTKGEISDTVAPCHFLA
jgi:hypothetical protein